MKTASTLLARTIFAASYSVICYIQDEQLVQASERVAGLRVWVDTRRRGAMALILAMGLIHLFPLHPSAVHEAVTLHELVHFGTAGLFASAGVLEASARYVGWKRCTDLRRGWPPPKSGLLSIGRKKLADDTCKEHTRCFKPSPPDSFCPPEPQPLPLASR